MTENYSKTQNFFLRIIKQKTKIIKKEAEAVKKILFENKQFINSNEVWKLEVEANVLKNNCYSKIWEI